MRSVSAINCTESLAKYTRALALIFFGYILLAYYLIPLYSILSHPSGRPSSEHQVVV